MTAVDQLQFMAEKRHYAEAAHLIEAIDQLLGHFKSYKSIAKVNGLRQSVKVTRDGLTKQIFEDFESLGEISSDFADPSDEMYYLDTHATPESLRGACLVAASLGDDCRRTLMRSVCTTWLKPYDKVFSPGEVDAGLDTFERRFSWLRRLQRQNEERYKNVFPSEWRMQHNLASAFAQRTAKHVKSVLASYESPDAIEVSALMRALKRTLDFEKEMTSRYVSTLPKEKARRAESSSVVSDEEDSSSDIEEKERRKDSTSDLMFDDEGNMIDPMSAEGVRLKYKRIKEGKAKRAAAAAEAAARRKKSQINGSDGAAAEIDVDVTERRQVQIRAEIRASPPFEGLISSCFEPYLSSYVKLESAT